MRLATYLKESGSVQAHLAQGLSISQGAVSRYARGLRMPRPSILLRIEALTNGEVRASDFLEHIREMAAARLDPPVHLHPDDFFDLPAPAPSVGAGEGART